MAGNGNMRGPAARAGAAGCASTRRRIGPVSWLLFHVVCVAASVGLMWFAPVLPLPGALRGVTFFVSALLIPLALLVVPAVTLRHVPHKKAPKSAVFGLLVSIVTAVALAVITQSGADEHALAKRGRLRTAGAARRLVGPG